MVHLYMKLQKPISLLAGNASLLYYEEPELGGACEPRAYCLRIWSMLHVCPGHSSILPAGRGSKAARAVQESDLPCAARRIADAVQPTMRRQTWDIYTLRLGPVPLLWKT